MVTHLKLKTGDQVSVRAGKDRGKKGKIIQVFPEQSRVAVEGVNQRTKHVRTRGRGGEKGQKITFWAPLQVSNLGLVCTSCSKTTRVGMKILEDGKKVRVCKKCSAQL